ncbi:uncharacterized protein LOC131676844 [Topomyia yanbarensis]|uniref:uncharacterized protein LOC131676844 n=1 Tax=Topomyia yanbarensis TaxID=2498891 RepID=UPI00273C03F6|nr:uncharacterized protein LOC131676844 [Topomyia yanbarensis]
MVKVEKLSSIEDSGSDSDDDISQQEPLAFSTQMSPNENKQIDSSEDETASEESEDNQPVSQSSASFTPKTVKDTMQKYLTKFPNVRVSKLKYSVDVDLTDPDDEIWLVKCPVSVDAKKFLSNAKLNSSSFEHVSQIESPSQVRLEAFVSKNSSKKPATILSGTDFKSFVPIGTIQIRETLETAEVPQPHKQESEDEVPFPEIIRERHPLLGLNYKSALKLPKHVKKSLSVAQQRANKFYFEKSSGNSVEHVGKRKRNDTGELSADCSTADVVKMILKQEAQFPARKKTKKGKEKTVAEDDLSWLQNI